MLDDHGRGGRPMTGEPGEAAVAAAVRAIALGDGGGDEFTRDGVCVVAGRGALQFGGGDEYPHDVPLSVG